MYTRPEERTLYVGIIAILRFTWMVCIGAELLGDLAASSIVIDD
ncbi:hypothetical protein C5167_019522 [Papaver somniferum]|uniref:Uncharacterized protein n=1 Tax=Papaver somniferum TaxID=3469 RepID=A0A4Y7IQX9_PAPSO|nr:hypothetical protein C5167_019522 [Papaver somniferum]